MNRETAEAYVATWAQTASDPTLTEGEITACIDGALVVDVDGLLVTDDGYTETVNGPRAVYNAWCLKAAKAALYVDVSADGTSVSASQTVAAVERQRRVWLAKCTPVSADGWSPVDVADYLDWV